MLKKSLIIGIAALVVMSLLAACTRSATQSPIKSQATATTKGTTINAQGTQPSRIEIIQTQTAVYLQTLNATSIPLQATSTPLGTPNSVTVVPPTGTFDTPVPGGTPVVVVPLPTPQRPGEYTVMPGEWPYCLARRFNIDLHDFLAANNLTTNSILYPNDVVKIPQTANPFIGARTLMTHPTNYTVPGGNVTIYKIACDFGDVYPEQIIAANGLTAPYTVHANQILVIP